MSELLAMSWNVRSLRSGRADVAAVIRDIAPDIALIQEAPRFLRWRSKRAALARESGMLVGTADRIGGLLIMTSMRTELLTAEWRPLAKSGRAQQRAVVSVSVAVAGESWLVATTHLGLDGRERRPHAEAIRKAVRPVPGLPLVLGADVNEEPGGAAWSALAEGLLDCTEASGPTFPAASPRRRIDAIFASPELEVVEAQRLDDVRVRSASDHLPLVVRLSRG